MGKQAYRIETRMVREADFPYQGETISSPEGVIAFARRMEDMDIEKILVLYLNQKNKLIGMKYYEGGNGYCLFSLRDVVKVALLLNAPSLIVVHNHPSGDNRPSQEDYDLTRSLKEALAFFQLKIIDHVIVSTDGYYSFLKEGVF